MKSGLKFLLVGFVCLFGGWVNSAQALEFMWLGRSINDRVSDLTSWILGIIGSVALMLLIVAGIGYVLSGGDSKASQWAKQIITGTITGLVLIMLAYAILALINKLLV